MEKYSAPRFIPSFVYIIFSVYLFIEGIFDLKKISLGSGYIMESLFFFALPLIIYSIIYFIFGLRILKNNFASDLSIIFLLLGWLVLYTPSYLSWSGESFIGIFIIILEFLLYIISIVLLITGVILAILSRKIIRQNP